MLKSSKVISIYEEENSPLVLEYVNHKDYWFEISASPQQFHTSDTITVTLRRILL